MSGIKEIRAVMTEAEEARRRLGRRTILFIDEIHRFNKAQQDAFLPRVEAGDIVLIGATTENPSFEVNSALLSRSKVYVLKPLEHGARSSEILRRALTDDERGLGARGVAADDDALAGIARYANGDARVALNMLELAAATARDDQDRSTRALVSELAQNRALLYDKSGEEHYNLISALHKSMRNSDPTRRCTGWRGCWRLARIRSTSRGGWCGSPPKTSATPIRRRSTVAVAAKDAVHFIGMPEGNTALAQAAIYLATAPKSNAVYRAYLDAAAAAAAGGRRAGAAAPAQRADAADEGSGIREGLPLRARRSGGHRRHGVPAAGAPRSPVLRTGRPRIRIDDPRTDQ